MKKKKELIFLGAILVLTLGVSIACFALTRKSGDTLVVRVNGEVYETYHLEKNQVVTVETDYGKNTFEIKDGKVSMKEADCPDGICTDHAEIANCGESIICLPHKLVLEIEGEAGGENVSADIMAK